MYAHTHIEQIHTLFFPPNQGKRKVKGRSHGDSVHRKAGRTEIKSPEMHNYYSFQPQINLFYTIWFELSQATDTEEGCHLLQAWSYQQKLN